MSPERFDKIYTWKPDGHGGVTLTLRQPTIDTRTVDPVGVPMPEGAHVRRLPSTRKPLTRDELLESQNSGQVISRGTIWDGAGINPRLDEKLSPVREFTRGFVPGNIVDAVDPGVVIRLGRIFTPHTQEEELRESMKRAIDEAEAEWKRDERSGAAKDQSRPCDVPPEPTKMPVGDGRGRLSLLARAARATVDYVTGLAPKRAAFTAPLQGTPVAAARMTPKEFAEMRRDKAAARLAAGRS